MVIQIFYTIFIFVEEKNVCQLKFTHRKNLRHENKIDTENFTLSPATKLTNKMKKKNIHQDKISSQSHAQTT